MGKIRPQVINQALDLARTEFDYLIAPGVAVRSLYVASMPAGATILLAFEGKDPFQVYPGWFMDMGECNWIDDGVSIVSPALVGQTFQLMVIPAAGADGGTSMGSGI